MKAWFELSRAEVETAIAEYLQRTLSTVITAAHIESMDAETFKIDVGFPDKLAPRGKTRCSACNAFGHNVATCPIPRPNQRSDHFETPPDIAKAVVHTLEVQPLDLEDPKGGKS